MPVSAASAAMAEFTAGVLADQAQHRERVFAGELVAGHEHAHRDADADVGAMFEGDLQVGGVSRAAEAATPSAVIC